MIIIVNILMMLYKKDGRGLHDIIVKTNDKRGMIRMGEHQELVRIEKQIE